MVVEEWLPSGLSGCLSLCRYGKPYFRRGLSCPARPESESESEVKKNWYFGAVELQCLSCSQQFNSGVASIESTPPPSSSSGCQ